MGVIRSARLRWAVHVERSEDGSLLKKIYRGKPDDIRCVGRHRKKWIEGIEEDGYKGMEEKNSGQKNCSMTSIARQALFLQGM
ncbi:hypothetical protein ANN_19278 [Periplaneta americana]|uniref:Uncharacterized protein n=1 Tax=Periplaneta americana TaxID=6978 RepID=A0ABQ8SAE5_PERAM|nr:hypothetical protein ANN_19278 [Periplaneta americana]